MPAFEPPFDVKSKNQTWVDVAKPGFRDPKRLWKKYWQQFNTITIPIQDEDAYFADAISAAGQAENRQHLEELLASKSAERRRDLQKLTVDIARASLEPRHPFPSSAARRYALKVGRTGSLDSFLQFVCGVAFGWPEHDREDDERPQIKHDIPIDAVDDDALGVGERDDDTSEIFDGDEYADENGRPLSDAWDCWETDEDDAWNDTSWKITECPGDGEPAERKPLAEPSISRQGTSLAEAGREAPQTVPDQAADSSGSVPSASPESLSPTPNTPAPSPPAKNTSVDRVPSLASDATLPTESQGSEQSIFKQSHEPPDVKAADEPWPPGKSEFLAECDGGLSGHGRSASLTDAGRGRKRAHQGGAYDDAECHRRKRRATDEGIDRGAAV